MNALINFWLPTKVGDALRRRALIVLATCAAIAVSCLLLILVWILSGDLQVVTVGAAALLLALLTGLAFLVRAGRVTTAAAILVGLLFLLVTLDAWSYGLASPAAAAYLIPIVLGIVTLGHARHSGMHGILLLAAATLSIWLLAWGEVAGWHVPWGPVAIDHLTFNAPALTVIYVLVALPVSLAVDGSGGQFSPTTDNQ